MNLEEFSQLLKKSTTEIELKNALNAYLCRFNITGYSFTLYSGHTKSGMKLKYHFASEALAGWHAYYLEQKYGDMDRTLEESHTMILPLFWDINEQVRKARNNREIKIRQESIDYGIDKGISLPVHGPNLDFCTLNLHQFRNESCLKNYHCFQYEWLSAAKIFYHYISKFIDLNKTASINNILTKREKQCLNLTAKMWGLKQIAKELGISTRTVNFHIQNANKKLGTNNKYQSINKFI